MFVAYPKNSPSFSGLDTKMPARRSGGSHGLNERIHALFLGALAMTVDFL